MNKTHLPKNTSKLKVPHLPLHVMFASSKNNSTMQQCKTERSPF